MSKGKCNIINGKAMQKFYFFRKYFYGAIFYSLHEKITKHIKKKTSENSNNAV